MRLKKLSTSRQVIAAKRISPIKERIQSALQHYCHHRELTLVILSFFALFWASPAFGSSKSKETAPTPADSSKAQNETLEEVRFVAYNLRNYLHMKRRIDGKSTPNALKPEKEISTLINYLREIQPDILGVCEIGSKKTTLTFQARLKEAGIDLPHLEWLRASNSARNLVLLSKFPIVEKNSHADLEYTIDNDTLPMQRGILDVTVEINPEYQLRLIGLHLKSKRPVPQANQSLMRRNEAQLVRNHAVSILEEDPQTNLLVYGDLNDSRNEAPIRALQGRYRSKNYLEAIQLKDEHGQSWTYYWDYADNYSRFDFILGNKAVLPEINRENSYLFFDKDWYDASDHRPLVLSIRPVNQESIEKREKREKREKAKKSKKQKK